MNDAAQQTAMQRLAGLVNTGADYGRDGNWQAARLHFLAALHIDPNNPHALHNLCAALYHLEMYAASVSIGRRALVHSPPDLTPHIKNNIGAALTGLKRFAEAQRLIREVISTIPKEPWPHHGLGLALYMTGNLENALAEFDRAVTLEPRSAQFRSDRALTLLSMGEVQTGLFEYEARWQSSLLHKSRLWDLGVPQWQGEKCNKLLVHHEQGYGDTLMLCRWVPVLQEYCQHLTLAVPKELVTIMRQSFSEVDVYEWSDETLGKDYDFHAPMLSTLRWLGVEFGGDFRPKPYLKTETTELSTALPKAPFRVGLCWASGDHGPKLRQRRRVVPLEQFLPLSEIEGVRLISLQKGPHTNEIMDIGAEGIIFDIMNRCEDFAATASVINELDLVVSVDSAVVHLAGGLGKPTIMLGPYTRCWRWWHPKTGEPWYNNMQLLRQSANTSWQNATAALTMLVKSAALQRQRQINSNSGAKNGNDHVER